MKLNGKYSSWSEINFRIPQVSILAPLQFNIFLCDLFQSFLYLDIANYTADNTLHSININLNKVFLVRKRVKSFIQLVHRKSSEGKPEKDIFLRIQHKKVKLILGEWPSPTTNVKNFWVSILKISYHFSSM